MKKKSKEFGLRPATSFLNIVKSLLILASVFRFSERSRKAKRPVLFFYMFIRRRSVINGQTSITLVSFKYIWLWFRYIQTSFFSTQRSQKLRKMLQFSISCYFWYKLKSLKNQKHYERKNLASFSVKYEHLSPNKLRASS